MTKEQWLLFLYGIYPGAGVVFTGLLMAVLGFMMYGLLKLGYDQIPPHLKLEKFVSVALMAVGALLVVITSLLPPREIFLAILAAPTLKQVVSESVEHGKLHTIDELLDKSLDVLSKRLDTELEKYEKQKGGE